MESNVPPPSTTTEHERDQAGFGAVARTIASHKWIVASAVALSIAAVATWTFRQPKIYEAECTIEYDVNPLRPLGRTVEDVADPVTGFMMNHEFLETQNRILASRQVAERVARELSLHHDASFFGFKEGERSRFRGRSVEEAGELLRANLAVSAIHGTRLVRIRYRDSNPQRATTIANAVAETFRQKTIEDRLGSTVTALDLLKKQLDNLRGELGASELALHAFKENHNVLSLSMEDRQNQVASDITHLNQKLRETLDRRAEAAARLGRIRQLLSTDDPDDRAAGFAMVEAVQQIREKLRDKRLERARLSDEHGPNYPAVRELDAEILSLKEANDRELRGLMRSAEADVHEIGVIESDARRRLNDANEAGLQLGVREIEYAKLTRERENNAKLYNHVLQRTTETDLTRMVRSTHVRIVDLAVVPKAHVSPQPVTNLAAGAAAGLALGIGLALLLAQLDRRLKTAEEVEMLGLPVLGVLPNMDGSGKDPSGRDDRDLVVHTSPQSAVAENCRNIRTNLTFMAVDRPLKTLVVTSSHAQEGKTTVTSNLGIAFAQSGKRVLLIDTDLRRPRVHKAFGIQSRIGVTNVLTGDYTVKDVTRSTDIPNLDVVVCGPLAPNPSELLHQRRFSELIQQVSANYDLVLFDSPPLTAVTDAAIIAPQVDGVIVVLKSNQTTRDAVRAVLRRLRAVGGNIVGGVVNGFDPKHGTYGYGERTYYGNGAYYSDSEQPTPSTPTT